MAVGYNNEIVVFKNRAYTFQINAQGQLVATPAGGTPQNLGGTTFYSLGAGATDTFMLVAVRGTNDKLYTIITTDGVHWSDGLGNPGAFQDLGGILTDSPVVFRRGAYLTVVVTGTDGLRHQRYTNDGSTFVLWSPFDGHALPLGANLLDDAKDWTNYQLRAIQAMGANVVRLSMFYGGSLSPHFHVGTIGNLIDNAGIKTIIVRGSEASIYPQDTRNALNTDIGGSTLIQFIRNRDNTLFYFELGNEPDHTYQWGIDRNTNQGRNDPYGARYTALDTLDQVASDPAYSAPNLRWMISMPTDKGGNAPYDGKNYFDAFNSNPDGRGVIGQRFDAMAVHTYSFDFLDRAHQSASQPNGYGYNALATVDWAKAVANTPIFVTEAGINVVGFPGDPGNWQEICGRYVNSLASYDGPNGRVRGVTFFCIDDGNPEWYSTNRYAIDVNSSGVPDPNVSGSNVIGAR